MESMKNIFIIIVLSWVLAIKLWSDFTESVLNRQVYNKKYICQGCLIWDDSNCITPYKRIIQINIFSYLFIPVINCGYSLKFPQWGNSNDSIMLRQFQWYNGSSYITVSRYEVRRKEKKKNPKNNYFLVKISILSEVMQYYHCFDLVIIYTHAFTIDK